MSFLSSRPETLDDIDLDERQRRQEHTLLELKIETITEYTSVGIHLLGALNALRELASAGHIGLTEEGGNVTAFRLLTAETKERYLGEEQRDFDRQTKVINAALNGEPVSKWEAWMVEHIAAARGIDITGLEMVVQP